jgi:hypothetical protein
MKKNPERIKRKASVKIGSGPEPRSEFAKPVSAAQRIHQSSISPSPKPTNRIAVSAIELRPRDPSADQPAKNEGSGSVLINSHTSGDRGIDQQTAAASVGQIHLQTAETSKRRDSKDGILRPGADNRERGVSRDSDASHSQPKQYQKDRASQEKSQASPRAGATNAQMRSSGHSPELAIGGRSQHPAAPVTTVPATSKPIAIRGTLVDGWHRVEFENGVYEGYIRDNKRDGEGSYVWSDGSRYQGQWMDDLKHGTGKFAWTTGDLFEGEYSRDKRHGSGIKTYASGDRYEVTSVANPRESGLMEIRRAEESTLLPTVMSTMACSRTTRRKDMESRSGPMAPSMRVTGTTIRCTERAPSPGPRVMSIKATTIMESEKGRAPRPGPAALSTL